MKVWIPDTKTGKLIGMLFEQYRAITSMGNFKAFWLIGFEPWGRYKPGMMMTGKGQVFRPLFCGLWIRVPRSRFHRL